MIVTAPASSPSLRLPAVQQGSGDVPPPKRVEPSEPAPAVRGIGPEAQESIVVSNQVEPDPEGAGLSQEELELVARLAARDREVRQHEEAHVRVGGQYAGEPSYSFETGPDRKRYAIGGEVPIDVAPIAGDPEATVAKMEQVKAAALAPSEPSSADRQVAALAEAQRLQALADLAEMRREERALMNQESEAAFAEARAAIDPAEESEFDLAA